MASLKSIDPANGEIVARYPVMEKAAIDRALAKAVVAQAAWRDTPFAVRSAACRAAAAMLRAQKTELALLMAREMGKPVKEGVDEVEKCAACFEHYAEHAPRYLADEPAETEAGKSYVAFQPLGLVLAIMPWNFPLWQVVRFAAPALMAGNGGVLKHASSVTGCALALEKLLRKAGFPKHLFTTLVLPSKKVGKLIADPRIAAVTLTGSVGAGRAVAAAAGAALKKTVLELGGSDAYLILADADVGQTVDICVKARMINNGQSCIAAKRFIVEKKVAREFTALFVAAMAKIKMGDPSSPRTRLGPQASVELRDQLHAQVKKSVRQGAKLLLGGIIPDRAGAYYPPTVLGGVTPAMTAFREELFGPVAAIVEAKNEAEAIALANDSAFGLGSAVFSRDAARAERVALTLEAGAAFVNAQVKSDPRLPFGGIKQSGYGRELSSFGIREFVNAKTVWVAGGSKGKRIGGAE